MDILFFLKKDIGGKTLLLMKYLNVLEMKIVLVDMIHNV